LAIENKFTNDEDLNSGRI